jgi:hypothetical protein
MTIKSSRFKKRLSKSCHKNLFHFRKGLKDGRSRGKTKRAGRKKEIRRRKNHKMVKNLLKKCHNYIKKYVAPGKINVPGLRKIMCQD